MAETMIPFGHAVPDHRSEASVEPSADSPLQSRTVASRPSPVPAPGESADRAHSQPSAPAVGNSRPAPGESFTLTKAELAEMLFERVGLNKREAKDMVETFFDEIRGALERGGCVKLSGFGNFQLRDKPQRPGRNPKTGEEIPISARRVVTFHASQKLKSQIEGTET